MALADQIQEVAARYPDRRSAMLPALPAAEALAGCRRRRPWRWPTRSTTRPRARCRSRPSTTCSISSPSAGTEVEVCTNLSCALVGAQEVVRAFESELGISAGETTENGQVTFRVVECLSGCGHAGDRDRPSPAASRSGRRTSRRSSGFVPERKASSNTDERDLTRLADYQAIGGYKSIERGR